MIHKSPECMFTFKVRCIQVTHTLLPLHPTSNSHGNKRAGLKNLYGRLILTFLFMHICTICQVLVNVFLVSFFRHCVSPLLFRCRLLLTVQFFMFIRNFNLGISIYGQRVGKSAINHSIVRSRWA